jgi:hypothetical protein
MHCYIIVVGYIIYLLNLWHMWFIPSGDTQQAGESELWSFAMSAPQGGGFRHRRQRLSLHRLRPEEIRKRIEWGRQGMYIDMIW